jgi:hypothetical protein
MAEQKDIKYVNREFESFRQGLIEYAKTYFPTTYNDFTPASPGMMFMEMSAYVGDVLSFYLDNQIQETFLQYARQQENIYSLAYTMGYRPKVTGAAISNLTFYQLVPATVSASVTIPDFRYTLTVPANTLVASNTDSSTTFLVRDGIDFSFSSSEDPTQVSVYQVNTSTGQPEYFLLQKNREAISANITTYSASFGAAQKFNTVTISDEGIIGILDATDSNGNNWYEVPYLAQEMVFDDIRNTNVNDPNYSADTDARYLLRLTKQPRRFVSRFKDQSNLELQFGAGTVGSTPELIVPNPDNVGLGLPYKKSKLTTAFAPSNFLYTSTYGIAPSNTVLSIRYLAGGGAAANVPANDLTLIRTGGIQFTNSGLPAGAATDTIFNSLAVTNLEGATGGSDGDSLEDIRLNALASFSSQLRAVTLEDYVVRAVSMPSQYGTVAKVFAQPATISTSEVSQGPATLDLYVLSYDSAKKLRTASNAIKNNLRTYLSQYRIINDSVNIKDAFIVNIGVNFDIITLPNFNSNQVIVDCIAELQKYFNIDNWQINQPIIMRELYNLLDRVKGVQTVKNIQIVNKVGTADGYSVNAYDVQGALVNNVLYPSLDPCIFEVKFPDTDIQGRSVAL